MAAAESPPELTDQIQQWLVAHLSSFWGVLVVALVAGGFFLWTKWDEVKKWPGISWLFARLSRAPTPKSDPERFTVLVAQLENDGDRTHERLVVEALKELPGIQILTLDRTIAVESPVPERREQEGHVEARTFLAESGASILLWGTVLRHDDRTVPKLYWTGGRREVSYPQLAEKLQAMGLQETMASTTNKISRGAFTAAFLLECMEAVGCHTIRINAD